uniref:XRE family transcriptional regulator n=1 Tax=Oscillatoriales cyanobacterium SpSt-402 TaxID=2282168 RepID=A0A832H3S1_9CYAN
MARTESTAIADLIRGLRQQLNLSQARLAAHLRVSTRTVNRWENGHAIPSPMALNLIETRLQALKNSSSKELTATTQVLEKMRSQLKGGNRTA